MLDLIPIMFASIGLACFPAAWLAMRRELRARPVYVPRHRAIDGPSTMQRVAETQAGELLAGLADRGGDQVELSRPGRGVAAYRQLQTAELDTSTAERFYALVGHSLRPRSPWGTPLDDDSWEIPDGVELTAIAGGTR
jgi:hypothetical protein